MEEVVSRIDMEAVKGHVEWLSSLGSRVTGYPGSDAAAEYIYDFFSKYLVDVRYHYFTVAVPIDLGANITVRIAGREERVVQAYPFWPNLVQTCPTPPGGLTGPLSYVGYGLEELNGQDIDGSVVLMEFNSQYYWKQVASLGAKAIIFIEPDEALRVDAESKVTNIPMYVPRLYVTKSDGDYLKSLANRADVRATVVSDMRYENVEGKNVIGYAPGVDTQDEYMGISSYYDCFSYIPSISPGAEESLGISVLLELAKFFHENPPKRTVEFIAFEGHHENLAGSTEWTEEEMSNTVYTNGVDQFQLRVLFGLDYCSEVETLGVIAQDSFYPIGGEMYYTVVPPRNSWFESYMFSDILPAMQQQLGFNKDNVLQISLEASQLGWSAVPPVFDASAFEEAGGVAECYRTVQCFRTYLYTPSDTADRIDYKNLDAQLKWTYISLYAFANIDSYYISEDVIPERQHIEHWGFGTLEGKAVFYDYGTNLYEPIPNALVYFSKFPAQSSVSHSLFFWDYQRILIADENGRFTIHGVRPSTGTVNYYTVEVYKIDWNTGEIMFAPDMGEYGERKYEGKFRFEFGWMGTEEAPRYFVAFPCATIQIHSIVDPTTFQTGLQFHIMVHDFRSHGSLLSWGSTGVGAVRTSSVVGKMTEMRSEAGSLHGLYSVAKPPSGENAITEALVFVPVGTPVEIICTTGYYRWPTTVLINSTKENPQGSGYVLTRQGQTLDLQDTPYQAALELRYLAGSRLDMYRSLATMSPQAEQFYSAAINSLDTMVIERENKEHNSFFFESYNFWAYIINAYFETMKLTIDVSQSSVFFYLLLLPFAFLAERLIYPQMGKKRIVVLLTIFLAGAAVLLAFHPGYHIASSMFLVTIGFTVLALSLPVFIVVGSNVISMAGGVRRRLLGAHFAEISRIGAVLAAFSIGVENMRRRRFRTALTLLSLVLIVFSLVAFTSTFGITITQAYTWTGMETPYTGILIRNPDWTTQADGVYLYAQQQYAGVAVFAPRFWIYASGAGAASELTVRSPSTGSKTIAKAMLGITPEEEDVTGIGRAIVEGDLHLFGKEYRQLVAIISERLAADLDVEVGDTIDIYGMDFRIVGLLDGGRLNEIIDLDQERVSPLDLSVIVQTASLDKPAIVAHLDGNDVILVPFWAARERMREGSNAGIYTLSMKFPDIETTMNTAEKFALPRQMTLYASDGEGNVFVYLPRGSFSVGGWQLLVMPLVISFLMILNLMLGAVAERVNEIKVYSSVGLSPMHVSGFFFAEAVVHAVLGSTIGYLVGIVSLRVLYTYQIMPEGFIPNFSSSYVIVALAFASVATVSSTLYPMRSASRLVMPSVERKWEPTTKPREGEWTIPLPFSFESEAEVSGVMLFMSEFLAAHVSEKAGVFMASDISYEKKTDKEGNARVLSATTLLRPYDLGLLQRATIRAVPREAKYDFELYLSRLAGFLRLWETSAKDFAGVVRRQFLMWRSLTPDHRIEYGQKGLEREQQPR